MIKATQGTYNNTVPKAEMCLWEEQWLSCASQLSQWDVLADFGKSVENYEILLDCLWKVPDWAYMKENVIPKAQVEETPKLRLVQAFFSLHDRNANENWWQLPEMSVQSMNASTTTVSAARNSGSNSHNAFADLKDILETWRLRTPNEWDNMTIWYDLLQWRNEMYNAVIDAFKDYAQTNPQLHHLGYRDKAWNVNKLAHIARKQGLHDVCVSILDKMYGHSTMEVQVIIHLCHPYSTIRFHSIKCKYCLFQCNKLLQTFAKRWISWGNYCDMIYKETHEEYGCWNIAVSCFFQGIKYGVSNSRGHLARIFISS
uniref:PIK-related kinase FAT domain-containing protein n=1 Tax=Ananas comosus var. bracteatus TaxID=296719 RepID=A0A6V7PS87_ANACO|nr:unnamed protein product [Ananas comosus var. bracteatus]